MRRIGSKLSLIPNFLFLILALVLSGCGAVPDFTDGTDDEVENRSIDGTQNNLQNIFWGSSFTQLARLGPPEYSDGIADLAGDTRPNPRQISNQVSAQIGSNPNARHLSNFVFMWGQFLDHDIDLTPDDPGQPLLIPVPTGDPWFDFGNTGQAVIPFNRSRFDELTGTDSTNPRQQINVITAWIDASQVYGSDENRASWLRTGQDGKLKTSEGALLPFNDGSMDNAPDNSTELFVAGDVRANEQAALAAMHTLFVREHNRRCDELRAEHPDWTDEQIYQRARKWVGALIQAITFNEFIPALLGKETMGPDPGYDSLTDPTILNEFSTAYFRVGHSMLTHNLLRLDENGDEIPEGPLSLADAFFDPTRILLEGGIDPLIRGLAAQTMEEIDTRIVEEVRSFLFGAPGSGGLDLAALNIQRGRDHGLPDYNSLRALLGLSPVNDFSQITSDANLAQDLEDLYGSVDDIDPWVGALAEDHIPGASVGESIFTALVLQFDRLRFCDRFWYERDPAFHPSDLDRINETRLSDVIRRNSGIENIPDDVFRIP